MSNKVIFFSKTWYPAWIIDEVEELTKNPNIGSIDYQRHFRAARAALYLVAVLGSKTTSSLLNAEAQARYLERLSTLDAAHNEGQKRQASAEHCSARLLARGRSVIGAQTECPKAVRLLTVGTTHSSRKIRPAICAGPAVPSRPGPWPCSLALSLTGLGPYRRWQEKQWTISASVRRTA